MEDRKSRAALHVDGGLEVPTRCGELTQGHLGPAQHLVGHARGKAGVGRQHTLQGLAGGRIRVTRGLGEPSLEQGF
jgi:hypothetical protein